MYHCDTCGRSIAATRDDPVHKPGARTLCAECVKLPEPAAPAKRDGRGAAARERWARMTDEEKAERVRKMKAGRQAPDVGDPGDVT